MFNNKKEDIKKKEGEDKNKEEIAIFFKNDEIETIDGTKVSVKKISWDKEMRVTTILADIIQELFEGGVLKKEEAMKVKISDLGGLLMKFPDKLNKVTSIASILMDQDEEWVKANLDSERIIELLKPFFVKGGRVLEKVGFGNK